MLNTSKAFLRTFINTKSYSQKVAQPLRSKKPKSNLNAPKFFQDLKHVRVIGGNGGDGCISFLSAWCNENAGPDGGDGGNGAHVIFKASGNVKDLNNVPTLAKGDDGEKGYNKDCNGKNAQHFIIEVPIGTIIKNRDQQVIGDLYKEGLMFVAARGGAGGKGNRFFTTDTEQAPEICEYGAEGESMEYSVEVKSMAHVGLIGFPNAGKSTLLRAISRARPKVAPYPFTTLKPHLGIVQYDDYEQIAVADLPGLIEGSHKNRGLGIQFLKHAERCMALLYIIDVSSPEAEEHLNILQFELSQFSKSLQTRPQIVVANKIDLPEAEANLENLRKNTNLQIIAISAKLGINIKELLHQIRILYDEHNENNVE